MMRRDLLRAGLLAGLAPQTATALDAEAGPTAGDAQRIATILYGSDLSPDDAGKVAGIASGSLPNLEYLALLRADDAATPFGYPAMIAEASRGQ
jgi:hypothetical protein